MDNRLKQIQLAQVMDISRVTVASWIKRGKLIVDDEKLIDISLQHNKAWLDQKQSEGLEFDLNRIYKKEVKKRRNTDKPLPELKSKSEIAEIQKKKLQLEVKRLEKSNRLDQIKIEKAEGKLIPTDAAQHLFISSVMTIKALYKQDVEKVANIFKKRLEMTDEQYTEILRELTRAIDAIHTNVRTTLIEGIEGIVEDYQEVRGRGESK